MYEKQAFESDDYQVLKNIRHRLELDLQKEVCFVLVENILNIYLLQYVSLLAIYLLAT